MKEEMKEKMKERERERERERKRAFTIFQHKRKSYKRNSDRLASRLHIASI